jgi:hypothetical protein
MRCEKLSPRGREPVPCRLLRQRFGPECSTLKQRAYTWSPLCYSFRIAQRLKKGRPPAGSNLQRTLAQSLTIQHAEMLPEEALSIRNDMGPANGFEPLTCTLRVRSRVIPHNPQSLQSLKIPMKSRLLRLKGIIKTLDGGECAPRMPQRKRPCRYRSFPTTLPGFGRCKRFARPLIDE